MAWAPLSRSIGWQSNDGGKDETEPSIWSQDGTRLLFVRGLDEIDSTDLWTGNVVGTGLSQVTHSLGGYGATPGSPSR
jgi:hypothetical protein